MATNTDIIKSNRPNQARNNLVTMLSGVAATGASAAYEMSGKGSTFQVEGITTATVTIQVSNDKDTWYTGPTALTADGIASYTANYRYVRANVTAFTSGAITVTGNL